MGRSFNVDIQHNPYDIECCVARCREYPHALVHGLDESEARANMRDMIRCILDHEEGEGAGDQTFTCTYHHV